MTPHPRHLQDYIDLEAAKLRAPVCPECRTGKHGNCDGTAFDEGADDIVECVCPPAFGHAPRGTR